MNSEQIAKIQMYKGESVEEYWKPQISKKKEYVDLFHFWELREKFRAYGLDHLRAIKGQLLSKKFLDKQERLASYTYTAYCRIAAAHQSLLDLHSHIQKGDQMSMFYIFNAFEALHFFLGSALDNVAGVGNVILRYKHKEDSFSDFLKSFHNDTSITEQYPEAFSIFEEAYRVKDNYRDHISHRGRLASFVIPHKGKNIPFFEKDFSRSPSATSADSWRKTIRDIAEGRRNIVSAPELCETHLRIIERAVDTVFKIGFENIDSYLNAHSAQLAENSNEFYIDLSIVPNDAVYILFRCRDEVLPYLNMWYHKIGYKNLPKKCINSNCKSQNIEAMYYVSE